MEHKVTAPRFGKAVRDEWLLDWRWLHVNHARLEPPRAPSWRFSTNGGAAWKPNRTAFSFQVLPEALRSAAKSLGAFIGADGRDIAFVENATTDCNAVLRSLRPTAGDEVLVLSHGYQPVRNAVRYVAEPAGARVVEVEVAFPRPQPDAILAGIGAALTRRTRIAVIDHITSPSALVLPLVEIVALCRSAGVAVLVDGAHAPGQIPLDLRTIGADWYVGNCHKWLCAPKGCGFLWAAPERQADLHPVTISHGYGKGFLAEFDWTGTADRSAFLCVAAAIDFHERLGGPALMARNLALAAEAAGLLARRLGTELGVEGTMAGAMRVVRLPVTGAATPEHAAELRKRLLERRADAPLHAIDGGIWLRLSAHAYNEIADYEQLAEFLHEVL
jgi:isopenicillin-N epimerase